MMVDGLIVWSGNEYGHADRNGHESEIRAFLWIRTLLEPAAVSLIFCPGHIDISFDEHH
jgi:hypothetical protein